jgi:zona occludens toxin
MGHWLVTGEPGDGKSNYAITRIKEESEKTSPPRPVFYDGIVILDPVALPWEKIDGKKWFTAPAGSIVVLDEAQRHFRPRRRDDIPEHAEQMETGRHLGIDLWLITQDPSFIDPHERKLINTHHHVRRKMGTSWKTLYTWKGCNDFPKREASWAKAIDKAEITDNVAAYDWYRSTELNTTRRKIPKKVYFMGAVVLACFVVVPYAAYRVWSRTQPGGVTTATAVPGQPGLSTEASPGGYGKEKALTPTEYVQQFQARVPGLAYTAPVYDKATEVVQAPYPAACVQLGAVCKCYTQQATILADVPKLLCEQIVANGFFVAWQRQDREGYGRAAPDAKRQGATEGPGSPQAVRAELPGGVTTIGSSKPPVAPSGDIDDGPPPPPRARPPRLSSPGERY